MINELNPPNIECVVSGNDQLGETPLWCDQTQKLWWLDIEKPKLQSYDPATKKHDFLTMPGTYLGSQALTKSGDHLVAIDSDLHFLNFDTGETKPFVQVESGFDNRLNDGRVDGKGRLWIGTMDNQYTRPNGGLYKVDPDGTVTKMLEGINVSNGIAFSPNNDKFYFTDTRRYQTWVFDFDIDEGVLSNQRLFADYSQTGDRPDGACVDVDGCLWTAFFAGSRIVRYRPDGRIDCRITLPVSNPTCICFGGPELETLYISTASKFLSDDQLKSQPLAGALLAIQGIGQGLPENRFDRY